MAEIDQKKAKSASEEQQLIEEGYLFDRQIDPDTTFKAGDVIFSEGDIGEEAYLIISGAVEISCTNKEGHKTVISKVGENGIFGEMAWLVGGERLVTAVATTDTECHLIQRRAMQKKINEASPFVRGLLRVVINTLRAMNKA
jgi:CRP-like cAMP-binding protein